MNLIIVDKLEAARRQLETAIRLYFQSDDEVSIHTLAAAAYTVLRDINERRGGGLMLKDLRKLLGDDLARVFKRYINSPDNFLKHADKDPDHVTELDPRWTEVLLWRRARNTARLPGH